MRMFRMKSRTGLTIIEVMIATVVIVTAVLGAVAFRYYSMLDARKADDQVTAARIGLMLLEGWKGAGGIASYDPDAEFGSQITISTLASGAGAPSGFTDLGHYRIVSGGINYYASLSYKDETPTVSKILAARVSWMPEYKKTGVLSSSSDRRSVRLTVYAD